MTTYNAETDWKKIDWKKLKKFEKEYYDAKHDWRWWMEKRRSAKCGSVTFPTPNGVGKTWEWDAQVETTLYALVSFFHGKLHMTKKRIPRCDASGGTEIVVFTREMQEQLVGDLWKDFLLPETAAVVLEEPKVANG
jgi:hypothetical protein